MSIVETGEKITTVFTFLHAETGEKHTCVARTTVSTPLPPQGQFAWEKGTGYLDDGVTIPIDVPAQPMSYDDEDVTWLRGWPDVNSSEVVALLAGEALRDVGAVPQQMFGDLDSSGSYSNYSDENYMMIEVGASITAFALGQVRYGKVIDVRDEITMARWIPTIPPVPNRELWIDTTMEEVTWLRGHPAIDSVEVRALQAARALADDMRPVADPNAAWHAAGSLIGKGIAYLLKRARARKP